jgi:hypothetical protein
MIKVHNDPAKNHLRRYARARGQRVVQLASASRNPKELANWMPSCATTYDMLSRCSASNWFSSLLKGVPLAVAAAQHPFSCSQDRKTKGG